MMIADTPQSHVQQPPNHNAYYCKQIHKQKKTSGVEVNKHKDIFFVWKWLPNVLSYILDSCSGVHNGSDSVIIGTR